MFSFTNHPILGRFSSRSITSGRRGNGYHTRPDANTQRISSQPSLSPQSLFAGYES
ncbi:MAG: hypothetical protein AAGE92_09010 [Cyanobacteria bacterium P01_G01_bin.4]